jgi:type II secretory pathway component GspD/PulD (secretin)
MSRAVCCFVIYCLACATGVLPALGSDQFDWNTNQNRVSVDVRAEQLNKLLQKIADATGWKVYVEPQTAHNVSVKFKDLPPGDALHLLLGDVNFALVPATNSRSRLFVFRTSREHATQAIEPSKSTSHPASKAIS